MEPRIQYAQTADGVSIAFCSLGEGAPLVDLGSQPYTNFQVRLQNPLYHPWNERLGANRRHIQMDGRGAGLSQRDVTDFSLDARVLDVEAVVDRLDLQRFGLCAVSGSGPGAFAPAAPPPARVCP